MSRTDLEVGKRRGRHPRQSKGQGAPCTQEIANFRDCGIKHLEAVRHGRGAVEMAKQGPCGLLMVPDL